MTTSAILSKGASAKMRFVAYGVLRMRSPGPGPGQRKLDPAQQLGVDDRLVQHGHRAGLSGPVGKEWIAVAGHEDRGNIQATASKDVEKIKPAKSWHELVDQQTAAFLQVLLTQEYLCVRVAADRQAVPFQKHPQRFPDAAIIVHDANNTLSQSIETFAHASS